MDWRKREDQKNTAGNREMSWMSKKTGRPKEQGGHRRINISVDKPTRVVLQRTENKSRFIEYAIHAWGHSTRKRFFEPKETLNGDKYTFKDAAIFIWTPDNSTDNAILSVSCYFQYRCTCEGFRFRMVINEEASSSVAAGSMSHNYTWSRVFTDRDFGLQREIKTFPNQSSYKIIFQFEPQSSSCIVCVKDINIFLEVVDGMPAVSP